MGVPHHIQKFGVDVRLTLKIKIQVKQVAMQIIDRAAEKIFLHIARIAAESAQAAGAFRAAQVAGGSRFYTQCHWQAPLYRPAQEAGEVVRREYQCKIPGTPGSDFADKIETVIPEQRHGAKIIQSTVISRQSSVDSQESTVSSRRINVYFCYKKSHT